MVGRAPLQDQDRSGPTLHESIRFQKNKTTDKRMIVLLVLYTIPFNRGFLTFLTSRAD